MLVITYLPDNTIQLQSPEIQSMIDNIADYSKVKVEATINCCPTVFSDEEILGPDIDTSKFVITSDSIIVKLAFFSSLLTAFPDGIYHFEVKLFKTNDTYIYQDNCIFIDITYKCQVAQYIKDLLVKEEAGSCATNVHILHYALVNGSNCGCNCKEMCEVFKELTRILKPNNVSTQTQIQGCGC